MADDLLQIKVAEQAIVDGRLYLLSDEEQRHVVIFGHGTVFSLPVVGHHILRRWTGANLRENNLRSYRVGVKVATKPP